MRRAIALILALGLLAVLPVGAGAKKGGNKAFEEQLAVNTAIPPDAASGASTPLTSQITVPKRFKKRVVGDLNVTNLQTTGNSGSAANDLAARLTAPNGRTTFLFNQVGDLSLGPWTMDDDSSISICNSPTPPCSLTAVSLPQPFAGTANLLTNFGGELRAGPLSSFDGVKMRGTWTLNVIDISGAVTNSTLNQWGLRIKPAKPAPE